MNMAAAWIQQTRRTYFGNAAAQRDFRVQLRGNRSVMLFGLYLSILMVVGYFKYDTIAQNATMSVVQAQRELRDFYMLIVMMLAGMVSVVTPGLAATTIVMERQRRSLDLIFSAPVAPRYYLVGKVIAVYRYIWMMLILSLPVTAACVVLGGASWSDVLTVYFLLSIHGVLLGAIGLLMSTITAKPVPAVIWTYIAVAGFLALTGTMSASAYSSSSYSLMTSGTSSGEMPFFIGLNPFAAMFTVGTYTNILGHHVPNFILSALAILLAVRLCLLGAGSILSDGRETANLRINWLVMAVASAFGLTAWMVNGSTYLTYNSSLAMSSPSHFVAFTMGVGLFWLLVPLMLAMPTLATYGNDGFQRQRPNGVFKIRKVFDGSPAGALPYVAILMTGCVLASLAALAVTHGPLPSLELIGYLFYVGAFWALFWSISRVASSYNLGLRTARTVVVATFIVLVVLPVPFLAGVAPFDLGRAGPSIWDLYILRPVIGVPNESSLLPFIDGGILAVATLFLNAWSERNRVRTGVLLA